SLVSAELASAWSGGHLRLGHGRHLAAGGFLAVWCQSALGPFSFMVKVSKDLGRPDGAWSRPVYRTCLSGRRCSAKYWCRRSPVLLERPRDRCLRECSWQRLLAVCCEHPWWVGCRGCRLTASSLLPRADRRSNSGRSTAPSRGWSAPVHPIG